MYKTSTINTFPRFRLISRMVVLLTTALLSLLVLALLVMRVPAVQGWAAQQGATWLSKKTNSQLSIDGLRMGYTGNLHLRNLLWRTAEGDTLLQINHLNTQLYWWQLPKQIHLSHFELNGLHLNLQQAADSSWNYDAIMRAFTGNDAATSDPASEPTSAPAPLLQLGTAHLANIKLKYASEPDGLDARLQFDSLHLQADTLDLHRGIYALQSLFVSALQLEVKQEARILKTEEEPPTESPLGRLRIGKLELHHTQLSYINENATYDLALSLLKLQLPEVDLARQLLHIDSLLLAGGNYHIQTTNTTPVNTTPTSQVQPFEWPNWQVKLGSLQLHEQAFSWHTETNSWNVGWQHFDAQLKYQAKQLVLSCKLQAFSGNLGWDLAQFSSQLELNDQRLQLHELDIRQARSRLTARGQLSYPNFNQLLQANEKTQIEIKLQLPAFYPADFEFVNQLFIAENSLQHLPNEQLAMALTIHGNLRQLQIDTLRLNWGQGTQLAGNGQLIRPLEAAHMQLNFPKIALKSVQRDLRLLLPNTQVAWPAEVKATGALAGHGQQLQTNWRVQLPEAAAKFEAHITNNDQLSFGLDADLSGSGWTALLGQDDWGDLGLQLAIEGSGSSLPELTLEVKGAFNSVEYLGHRYHDLHFEAALEKQELNFSANINQQPLAFNLQATALLDSAAPRAQVDLQLQRANFKTLGLTNQALTGSARVQAHYQQEGSLQQAHFFLHDALFENEEKKYPLDSFYLQARSDSSNFEAQVFGDLAQGQFEGNASLPDLLNGMRAELRRHLAILDTSGSFEQHLSLKGSIEIHANALLTDLLLPGLTRLDSTQLVLDYEQAAQRLELQLLAPAVDYQDLELRKLQFVVASRADSLYLRAGFDRLVQAPYLNIYPTRLQADLHNDTIQLQFTMEAEDEELLYALQCRVHGRNDTTYLHILPHHLKLNAQPWDIDPNNYLKLAPAYLNFEGLEIRRANQLLAFQQQNRDEIMLKLEGFKLSNLLALLNTDTLAPQATLAGFVGVRQLFTEPLAHTQISLQNLRMNAQNWGNLQISIAMQPGNVTDFELIGNGGDLHFTAGGKFDQAPSNPFLSMMLSIDTLQNRLITAVDTTYLSEAAGHLSGALSIAGSWPALLYEGHLQFNQTQFRVKPLNIRYQLSDERIQITEKGLFIKNLEVLDPNQQLLRLSGHIHTTNLLMPEFDLKLEASNFELMNVDAAGNPLLHGRALVNTKAKITGNLNQPVIHIDANLNKGSKLVFVVPSDDAELVAREGVVQFVDMRQRESIIDKQALPQRQEITGISLSALLKIDPATELTVVVDERSGDKLVLAGKADLQYELFPNGRTTLAGIYEVNRGSYDMNLYQLVQRKFELVKGSSIQWRGDALEASLDLKALYRIKTSATDLMTEQLAGADERTRSRYRQELPFEVYTEIKGDLLRPQVSFKLDMPEQARGSLEGNVYARLQQLNTRENELNKQVFSLLVLNSFLPTAASSSAPIAGNFARGSASQLLNAQLNSLSTRYLQGIGLDVNLNSVIDYENGQNTDRHVANVQLRKNLFHERLLVEVGSQVDLEGNSSTNDLLGNVNLEYLLTNDGMYRIRAFRRNQFEGILEGQLLITGTSLLFNREFNRFSEAFGSRAPRSKSDLKNLEGTP